MPNKEANYERMWKQLADQLSNLSPHYGELNKYGVLDLMDKIEKDNKPEYDD